MLLKIPNVLDKQDILRVRELLDQEQFEDGKLTAGWAARKVKKNMQLSIDASHIEELDKIIRTSMQRNNLFISAVLPRKMRPAIFARYEEGMEYGAHVDDAIMGIDSSFSSDVSFTIFLDPPESYEGGELKIMTSFGEQSFKLPEGSMILYPSSSLHRVTKVTKGRRQVVVSWIQSAVRSSERREILFDLNATRQSLGQNESCSKEFELVCKSYSNLLRLWSEP